MAPKRFPNSDAFQQNSKQQNLKTRQGEFDQGTIFQLHTNPGQADDNNSHNGNNINSINNDNNNNNSSKEEVENIIYKASCDLDLCEEAYFLTHHVQLSTQKKMIDFFTKISHIIHNEKSKNKKDDLKSVHQIITGRHEVIPKQLFKIYNNELEVAKYVVCFDHCRENETKKLQFINLQSKFKLSEVANKNNADTCRAFCQKNYEYLPKFKEMIDDMQNIVKEYVLSSSGEHLPKSLGRIVEKIFLEYNGDLSRLQDGLRSRFVVEPQHLYEVGRQICQYLNDKNWHFYINDTYVTEKTIGYRSIFFHFCPNVDNYSNLVCELQLITFGMMQVMTNHETHKFFKIDRCFVGQEKLLEYLVKCLEERNYWQSCQKCNWNNEMKHENSSVTLKYHNHNHNYNHNYNHKQ